MPHTKHAGSSGGKEVRHLACIAKRRDKTVPPGGGVFLVVGVVIANGSQCVVNAKPSLCRDAACTLLGAGNDEALSDANCI
jgi:hypothetical protein